MVQEPGARGEDSGQEAAVLKGGGRHGQATSDVGTVAVPADGLLPATHVSASEPLVRARTQWVYVELDSGRPLRVPTALIEAFMGTGTAHPGGDSQASLR